MAGPGAAWPGRARQAWQGLARQGEARPGKAGEAGHGTAGLGRARQARTTEEQNMIDVLLQLPPLIWVWAETIAYGTPLIVGVLAVKEACK